MKILRFFITLSITLSIVITLNVKIGSIPPLGKFLDPFNGFWANAKSNHEMPQQLALAGLKQPVEILYDDLLIPHIFAENDLDLYLATGYVHAYHRLWQMEFQTHAAAGRLSEIVGTITLDMDRGQRRKGMVFGAENFINNLDDVSAEIINHYTSGINSYINQLSYEDYPFEYKLLDYKPENWNPLKSGLLYKYMSDMLNSSEKDLENTNFRSIYGKQLLDLIYPDVDNYADPVVDRTGQWDFDPIVKDTNQITKKSDDLISAALLPQPNPNNGSNNWVVGGNKSETGNPILCNDMHLSLYMPSLWFYMQQKSREINVFGHCLPGTPFVITGFTDSIAWGFTNAQRDLVDWYKIEYEDDRRDSYFLDGSYIPTEKKIEEFKIRGSESYYDTVVYTNFGPVTYDNSFHGVSKKNGYARRWIDHDPSGGFNMFYKMNSARNISDYQEALDYFTSPAQNVIFASVQGDIAHRIQGKYPINNFEEGKFLKDGTRSSSNWSTFIPNDQNAFWKNPERGFVSSANQQPVDSTYPYYVTARSFEAYRNRRINDILENDNSVSIEDMKNLHFDNYSLKAAEALPWMLEQMHGLSLSAKELDVIEQMKRWNYYFYPDLKAAAYFDIWIDKLFMSIWDEIKNSRKDHISLAYPTIYSTINLLKNHPDLPFFNDVSTEGKEGVKDLVLMSFREMMVVVNTWETEHGNEINWSDYKSTFVGHQLRIKPLGSFRIKAGGNGGDVVNATGTNHGPSQRIIVELDPNGVKAWGHYPGGQSGNPGSKYYDNMVDAWAKGHYYELLLLSSPEEDNKRIIFSQTLTSK